MASLPLEHAFKKLLGFRKERSIGEEDNAGARQAIEIPTYSPLRADRKEIRVLHLNPGQWNAQISCQLSTTSLIDTNVRYEALSYVWSAESGLEEIMLCGQPYNITRNLFLALRRLRNARKPRVMWVDSLCIDQTNDDEKSVQVALMGDIYKSCARVYLWLGDYGEASTRTIEENHSLPWFGGKGSHKKLMEEDGYRLFYFLYELAENKHWGDTACCSESDDGRSIVLDDRTVIALAAFVLSPWWRRLWVVQETILPSMVIVMFGSFTINWETLELAELTYRNHLNKCCMRYWSELPRDMRAHIYQLNKDVFRLSETRGKQLLIRDFHEMLWRYRSRQASDPRDMVYGLLGCADGISSMIKPDYSLTKIQVYAKITLLLIQETGRLHILKGLRDPKGDMPSWIYDWSLPIDETEWANQIMRMENYIYTASSETRSAATVVNRDQLSLDAVYVDRVAVVGERFVRGLRPIAGIADFILSWYETVENFYTYTAPPYIVDTALAVGSWRDDFRRAITADCDITSKRVPTFNDYHFDNWWSIVVDGRRPGESIREEPFRDRFLANADGLALFITERGYLGLGNPTKGDEIWVLLGSDVPSMLRRSEGEEEYSLVGDCFLHGYMDGEAVNDLDYLTKNLRTVVLK